MGRNEVLRISSLIEFGLVGIYLFIYLLFYPRMLTLWWSFRFTFGILLVDRSSVRENLIRENDVEENLKDQRYERTLEF